MGLDGAAWFDEQGRLVGTGTILVRAGKSESFAIAADAIREISQRTQQALDAIAAAKSPNNPRLPPRMPRVGDTWKYVHIDRWTNITKGPFVHRATSVSPQQIHETVRLEASDNGSEQIFTREAAFTEHSLSGMPEFAPFLQAFDALEKPGEWRAIPAESDNAMKWSFNGRITGTETITVPAGTFDATRVELEASRPMDYGDVRATQSRKDRIYVTRVTYVVWYVPEVKRIVKCTRDEMNWNAHPGDMETYELVGYKLN